MKYKYTEEQKQAILREQLQGDLSNKEICDKYNLNVKIIYYWREKFGIDLSEVKLSEKLLAEHIKAHVEIRGLNKMYFVKDCRQRKWQQGKLLKHIIDVYYSIMSNRPDLQGKEMSEIKSYINSVIKL
jgi:transposase-like protein